MSAIDSEVPTAFMNYGLGIFRLAFVVERAGWSTPLGGLPYFHVNTPATDLIRWCEGDQAAADRLRSCLPELTPLLLDPMRFGQ